VDIQKVLRNLPYAEIFDREVKQKEGVVTKNGTFCVSTGKFTGRSPKDKYFVKQVKPALHQFCLAAHSCTDTVVQSALATSCCNSRACSLPLRRTLTGAM
jgi:Phosphoenolpyruvate carboxykinase